MVFAVALVAVALTLQPAKSPEKQGVAKAKSAETTSQAEHPAKSNEQTQATVSTPSNAPSPSRDSQAGTSGDDLEIQRRIEVFTGGLVVVGLLQTGVMFLTWLIYRRQAHEMRRQRHEMRRQRHVMFRQWKAMRAQLDQMESAGKQTNQLIEQAGKQVEQLTSAAEAANNSAEAAQHTVEMMRLDQRAWVGASKIRITDFHPGKTVKVMIRLRNFGNSLAFNVTADKYVDPWLNTRRNRWSASGTNHPNITLFPNGDFWLPAQSESDISAIIYLAK
jgi:hypothetical protein